MKILWDPERLVSLCSHKDKDVRRWAADKLKRHYPEEAAETLARLLSDSEQPVAALAASYFCDRPQGGYVDDLLSALETSSGRVAGRLSRAVGLLRDSRLLEVVRHKYSHEPVEDAMGFALALPAVALLQTDASRAYVEECLPRLPSLPFMESFSGSFFVANLTAGTELPRLLRFAIQNRPEKTFPSLLFEALRKWGSWVSRDDLSEKPAKGRSRKDLPLMVQESLESIDEMGYTGTAETLKQLFQKRRYDEVVAESHELSLTILDERSRIAGEEEMRSWQENREMPLLCVDFLSALQAVMHEVPKGIKETVARSALAGLAALAELKSLIGVNPEKLDREAALHLFIQDRTDTPQDRQIMEILAADGQIDATVDFLLDYLKGHAYMESAPRIVRFLSRFMNEALGRELLSMDFAGEDLDNAICLAVGRLSQGAIPLLRPILEKNDQDRLPLAMEILEDLPCEESVELVLTHWVSLWAGHREWLLDLSESLGDKRFIALLREELREGEPEEGEVFRLLCLIHGVTDPELKRIEREAKERRLREERIAEAIDAGDYGALLYEPIDVSLTCRSCKGLFHYRVRRISVVMDTEDIVIADTIVCKRCGAVDHYEAGDDLVLAVTARLAVLNALPEGEEPDLDGMTIVPVRTTSALGEGLSIKEMFAKYEKKLAKEPDNPELLLGYANLLRQAKRAEEAMSFYQKALERDPLAVEALACLGDHASFKGELEVAFDRFAKAADILDKAHYYRTQTDVDLFREVILDRLAETAERLGRKAPFQTPFAGGMTMTGDTRKKVGRNDPCPCGSGKKYKKCCLLKESEQGLSSSSHQEPRKPVVDVVYQGLRKKLDDYCREAVKRKDFLRGVAVYWDTEPKEPLVLPEGADKDQGEFNEWLLLDFPMGNGKTVAENFLESREKGLTEGERAIAEALSKSYQSVYEVQEVREGSGLTIKDLFTGQEMDVQEISGSYSIVLWDILHMRVYSIGNTHKFAGNGQILPRNHINELVRYVNDAYRAFQDQSGPKPLSAFLKENPFLINRFLDSLVYVPPVLLTEEKHRVISSRAHFSVSNYDRARNILVRQYDFGDPEELKPKGVRLAWLKRGASKAWEMGTEEIENAIITTSNMIHPSGKLDWTVLGTVTLYPQKLTVECMSKERLERAKQRLEQLLGALIRHRADEFEDISVGMDRVRQRKGHQEKPVLDDKAQAMAASVIRQRMSAWPDEKLPALNGKTPREAMATKEGKEKVLELIKNFENVEARKKKGGELWLDLAFLRKELGL